MDLWSGKEDPGIDGRHPEPGPGAQQVPDHPLLPGVQVQDVGRGDDLEGEVDSSGHHHHVVQPGAGVTPDVLTQI